MNFRKRLGLTSALVTVCTLASLSWTSTTFAHDPMHPKLNAYFRLGVGGEYEGRAGSGPYQRHGMSPSFGGGLELEVPLNPTFSLGAAFDAYTWTAANARDGYNVSLDFLFVPRVRIPFGDHPWHAEVYFGVPVGPTVSLPHERFATAVGAGPLDVGLGVTASGRVGVRMNVDELVGFFIDVGPVIQYVSYPTRTGPNFDLWNYQFALRAGGSFGVR